HPRAVAGRITTVCRRRDTTPAITAAVHPPLVFRFAAADVFEKVTITTVPFTLAHPAAVLPLRRRGLVFSALVVGSMAPDFEYFFGLKRPISHTMPGI